MAITKVINDAVDLNQTTDYSGLRLPVGTTGNVVESFTTDYLVVGGGGSGSLQGAGGAGGLRTSYNNSTTTTNTLSFPSGKTAIATYMLDNNATDISGNYNGTESYITYNTGQYGGGAVFNGSSSYITADKSMFGTGDGVANLWSISLWFKTDGSVTASRTLIGTKGNSAQAGFFLYMLSGGQIRYYEGNTSSNSQQLTTTATYDDSNWHNIVITRSGTTDVLTMYIDGTEVIAPTTMTNPHTSHNFNLHIGRYPASAIFFWDGSIDQVRIYNSALSSTDVTNIYNNEVQANSGGGTASESSLTLSAGTAYDVTIGAGGIDTYTSGGSSGSGANSIFSTITSIGGGGAGATSGGASAASGKNGGSGGGAGSNTGGSPGNGTLGQGYIGGTALFYGGSYAGGGGGGATSSGGNTTSSTVAGNGGAQLNLAITGNSVGYAGGGGGSLYGTGTVGTNDSSAGAAAPSGSSSANGESAPFNLGGGGGGANHITGTTNITGGAGGSGVVILRYPTASVSSFTTTGTLNTPSTTDTIADTAYPVANTAYYKLDNSAIDLSGSTGKFDQGGVFNGTTSRIPIPKINSLTADVTVSGWLNLGNTTTSNRIRFIEINTDANGYAGTLSIYYKPSNGEWQARSGNGTSSNSNVLTHTYTLTQSTWYHVCFTRDDSTNVTKFYINGSLQDTETVSVSSSYPSNATSVIGDLNYTTGSNYNWLGEMDQIRIYDTALSSTDVTALYNETVSTTGQLNFPSGQTAIATYELNGNANGILTTTDLSTVNYPAGAGCIALYEMNGTADDTSGAYNGTPSNIDYNFGAFGQTAVFNGGNAIITLPNTSSISQRNDFSWSYWVKPNGFTANGTVFRFTSNAYTSHEIRTNGVLMFYDGTVYTTGSGEITDGVWQHVAVTKSSTSGIVIYVNGISVLNNSSTTDAPNTTATNRIGGWDGTNYGFSGSIDQVRIFNTALTQAQVTTLARGIGTSYSGADTNVLYAYNGTPTNVTYENGRFNKAAVFNGTNSYIYASNSVQQPTTNFSASVWVLFHQIKTSSVGVIGNFKTGVTPQVGWAIAHQNGTPLQFWADGTANSNGGMVQSTSSIPTNEWIHVVGTYDGSNVKIYINGSLENTKSYTQTPATTDQPLVIGRWYGNFNGSYTDGQIDQARIYDAALTDSQVTELYNEHYQTQFTEGSDTAIVFTQGTGTVTFSGIDPAPPQGALRTNTSYSEDGSGSVIEHYNGTDWKYFDAIKYCTTNTLNFPSGAGCIASYNLNNNVNDIGNTYNGVNSNVTFTASGKFGAAAVFNGSSSYISIPQGSLPVGASARTVSMWINTTQTTLAELYGYGVDGNNLYYAVNINAAAGKIGTAFYANDHNFTASVIDGAWHHIVSVYNGNTVEMYVDGQSVGNATAGAVNTSAAGSPKIGKYNYTGSIDQVRIFNDSLTSDEVTQLYNNEIACS